MKKIIVLFFGCFIYTGAIAQPAIEWVRTCGGDQFDRGTCVTPISDGGYAIAGYSSSDNLFGGINHGETDVWLVKMNGTGGIIWQKSFGGTGTDSAQHIRQTPDGGYIIGGTTDSNNGDVSGNHGGYDCWIIKTDSSGNIQWQKTYGGSADEGTTSIELTADGGYIVSGHAFSSNGDVSGQHGLVDAWILKLGSTGTLEWQKSLGGTGSDFGSEIKQTSDGGYILTGFSDSNNEDVAGNHGNFDMWVVKLSSTGTIQWQKSLGGSEYDAGLSTQQTTDGGYIIAGFSKSNNGDVAGNHGMDDFWVVKLNQSGVLMWQKSLGGPENDIAQSIKQTMDGGYIVFGLVMGNGGDITGYHDAMDYWAVKLSATGNIQWKKTMGGSNEDQGFYVDQTPDGGYVMTGNSSSIDGDLTTGSTEGNFWTVKLAADPMTTKDFTAGMITVYPNPGNGTFTIKSDSDISGPTEVKLYSTLGKLVYSKEISIDDATAGTQVNAGDLAPGIYILQLNNAGKSFTQKLIIE